MKSDHNKPPFEDEHKADGYFRRDVDQFHREANVLAGHDAEDVSAGPPENLTARRLVVFSILVVAGLLATGLAMGLMSIPACENPQYNWMPCLPNF